MFATLKLKNGQKRPTTSENAQKRSKTFKNVQNVRNVRKRPKTFKREIGGVVRGAAVASFPITVGTPPGESTAGDEPLSTATWTEACAQTVGAAPRAEASAAGAAASAAAPAS